MFLLRGEDRFLIQYYDIPSKIEKYFKFGENIEWNYRVKEEARTNCREMVSSEILYWNKNKEDIEIHIDANKYNL